MTTATSAAQPLNVQALLRLQTWLSPAFPIGAFSYSHGLETAITLGAVHDKDSAKSWLHTVLYSGSGWNDALVFCEAWHAAAQADGERLASVNALSLAMAPSKERYLETVQQGEAFLSAASPWLPLELDGLPTGKAAALPVTVGAISASCGVPLQAALSAYLQAFLSNLVSCMVRYVPLGQIAGVELLQSLEECIIELAEKGSAATLDDLGSAAITSDIASMAHETLRTRIFRS